jgi:fucose permease
LSTPISQPIPGSAGPGQPAARGMFTLADGRRVGLTFALVTSLFLLWGFFLSYFFMSIMFPTIFALGIHDLGRRAKQASAFIVMAIVGGAMLPKLMGFVADHSDMSRAFIVPLFCFALVALYAWRWPVLSGCADGSGGRPEGRH